jgi:CheY-like chemotaxis protein/two-component sensor histidine kinase
LNIHDQMEVQAALRESEERLRTLADSLEQGVQQRTEELVQSQGRLRALATELNLAEQRERQRLATELHDHLAQMLVLSRLKLGQVRRVARLDAQSGELLAQTDDVLDQSLAYTRTLVADLSPPVLHEFGLFAALKWLGEYMRRYDLEVTLELTDDAELTLPEDQSVLIFQSVRELLMNAAKHAGSDRVRVAVERRNNRLSIEVCDDGRGFDLRAVLSDRPTADMSSRFGLFSIRERMRALGGSFEVESTPGKGTCAVLLLPWPSPGERRRPDRRLGEYNPVSIPSSAESSEAEPGMIRVLLVDDHAMVRQGLRSMLETYADVEVAGEAGNGLEAVRTVEVLRPSVVVMDINMPLMNGIEATKQIKARFPDTIVIGLSVNASGDNQAAMRAAGAAQLITKEAAVEQLYVSIQQAVSRNNG